MIWRGVDALTVKRSAEREWLRNEMVRDDCERA